MKLFGKFDFGKLKSGLDKTRNKLVNRISEAISGKAELDDETMENLEEILVTSDISFDLTQLILENTRKSLVNKKERGQAQIIETLEEELKKILDNPESENNKNISAYKPYIILIVGVNGSGKTTTVGKLAYNFKNSGLNVVVGSADTFRAAANEQLEIWANRAGVKLIKKDSGADPSSVAYDTLVAAKKENADVVLIDTAGRLHTKSNLMNELKKIKSVMAKVIDYAPNETILVVDGNTGQNAINQANEFSKFTELTGLIITKLDGTAKGGAIFQISYDKKLPIKYIGVGESIEDLQPFNPKEFVNALFSTN